MIQGSGHYKHHLETLRPPVRDGYKDIIPLWKAEKWDPDRLMALYKKAGAKYFVSMGSHHDNFYLWNSKLHKWNAVNMGPKRDVVGDWQKAAKKHGLRFGVSEHLGASFTWFQASHGADKTGPKAGVPYDGADPKYQDLYHFPAEPDDKGWYSKNPRWQQQWFDRIKELVDNYQPDLLYTDGGVPFGNEVGRSLIAHLYNADAARHGGKPQVVYTCKQKSEGRWIEDLERGVMPEDRPDPWQTDTSIGDWYYNKNWKFRAGELGDPHAGGHRQQERQPAAERRAAARRLARSGGRADARADGRVDRHPRRGHLRHAALAGLRRRARSGPRAATSRRTSPTPPRTSASPPRAPTLYAIALGWPADGKLVIRSLAKPAGKVTGGQPAGLRRASSTWQQTADGLVVTVPAQKPSEYTCALKITGDGPQARARSRKSPSSSAADAKGNFTLAPDDAELHGDQIKVEAQGGQPNIGFWDKAEDWVSWKVKFDKPGTSTVSASCSTIHRRRRVRRRGRPGAPPASNSLARRRGPSGWADFRVAGPRPRSKSSSRENRPSRSAPATPRAGRRSTSASSD